MDSIANNSPPIYFVYGYGGTGKTFLWNNILATLRSIGEIVINVASSDIASLLLPNGKTAHFRFKIPLNINEDFICNIKPNSSTAKLIQSAKLIIWDEAPMLSKYCFEALDKSMKDVLSLFSHINSELPFGGKIVVLGGDFRQILLVISKGSRQDIVLSTINSSYLWSHCKVLTLTKNMRLSKSTTTENNNKILEFSNWLLRIGDGIEGDSVDGESIVKLPTDICIKQTNKSIENLINFVYPSIITDFKSINYFNECSILAPTLEDVEIINSNIMKCILGDVKEYLSFDTLCNDESSMEFELHAFSTDILNSINCSGLPPHKLILKEGVPVMILRNIDQSKGLCNGTRLLVRMLAKHIMECMVISGTKIGDIVLIPRLNMMPSNINLPIRFQRRQFSLVVSFAMTINKAQGQTLSRVGLYLPRPVFSHGQLYVALSRVKTKDGLRILLQNQDCFGENKTVNVVYREIFQNM